MSVNPNSLKNLKKAVKFTKGDSRIKNGRAKGSRNRRTIFLELLEHMSDCTDPAGNTVELSLADQIALAIINKATEGHVSAANLVLDCAYGKLKDIPEAEQPIPQIDWSRYTEEDINLLNDLIKKGTPEQP